MGLPRLTNRPPKGVPEKRLAFVPQSLTNHSTGENFYIYMLKKKFKKMANRLITVLYHCLRRIKWGTHECRKAPDLYLLADNASENKNNEMFAFCSELVLQGWFQAVAMYFGHTHNGNDSTLLPQPIGG